MSDIDPNVWKIVALLRSVFPWRQRQGLREVARLAKVSQTNKAVARTLPAVLPHLDSFSRKHRKLAFEALEAAGEDGHDLLLIAGNTAGRRGRHARAWMTSRGFGIRKWAELMETGSPVARKYAAKRIIAEAGHHPDVLADVFIVQALRFRTSTAPRHSFSSSGNSAGVSSGGAALDSAAEAALYAALLTAVTNGDSTATESLKRYLADSRAEVRDAVFQAWSQTSAGRWLLIHHGLKETTANACDLVANGLAQSSDPQRRELLQKLDEGDRAVYPMVLRVMRKTPTSYVDQLPQLARLLIRPNINADANLLEQVAETIMAIAEALGIDEEQRIGHRRMLPFGQAANSTRRLHRAFGKSVAALCADAVTIAEAMLELLANQNYTTRRAAIFLLDIVSISLDQQWRSRVAEVLGFAALGESDEVGKRSIQDLIRRLSPRPEDNQSGGQSGGTLGFLRAA